MEKENRDGSDILELKCRHKEETCFYDKTSNNKIQKAVTLSEIKRKVEECRRMSEYIKPES